jgi:hypothetical protein
LAGVLSLLPIFTFSADVTGRKPLNTLCTQPNKSLVTL